jgi:hypothetical protein
MRRNIIKPPTVKPTTNPHRIAALKAHLTRAEDALKRWTRRLRRAANEVAKHQAAIVRYQKRLNQEIGPQ